MELHTVWNTNYRFSNKYGHRPVGIIGRGL